VFLVISVYFNLRNSLPKSGTFLPGHPVYVSIFIIVTPMEFKVNVLRMAAYRSVVTGVVTWLLPGRPCHPVFDCGQGYLN
jgi:hypothetical protein